MNKGPEVFKGKVMHSREYSKLNPEESSQLLKGKKVVVVGYKKSGIDLAMECAEANQGEEGKACTMVVRTSHWIVPHYSIWGFAILLVLFNQIFSVPPCKTKSRHSQDTALHAFFPCEKSSIQDHRILYTMEASTCQVWTKTRSPF